MERTALDISQTHNKGTGIGNYTHCLRHELAKLNAQVEFIDIPVINSNSILKKIYVNFWEQFLLPFYLLFKGIKVCHRTANIGIPFLKFSKYIITIHDIIPRLFENEYLKNPIKRFAYNTRMKWTVYAADKIIADSNCTKNDLIRYFNAKEDKIEVIYLGVDEKYKKINSINDINKVKDNFGIARPYILGIGGNEPRKNVKTLISAYLEYIKKYNGDYLLVIVGKPWFGCSYGDSYYTDTNGVIYTGYVEDEELVALYNGAEVFVFPSLYEGFGLPPLEAMACGTPVIASNNSSVSEILGDAAILADPINGEEISEMINKILQDDKLKESLILKGVGKIKTLTWKDTAIETLRIYKELN